jgi:hypothetical protein
VGRLLRGEVRRRMAGPWRGGWMDGDPAGSVPRRNGRPASGLQPNSPRPIREPLRPPPCNDRPYPTSPERAPRPPAQRPLPNNPSTCISTPPSAASSGPGSGLHSAGGTTSRTRRPSTAETRPGPAATACPWSGAAPPSRLCLRGVQHARRRRRSGHGVSRMPGYARGTPASPWSAAGRPARHRAPGRGCHPADRHVAPRRPARGPLGRMERFAGRLVGPPIIRRF